MSRRRALLERARSARDDATPAAFGPINVPPVLRQLWISSLSCLSPMPMPTQLLLLLFFGSTDAKATSKLRSPLPRGCVGVITRCRFADNFCYSRYQNYNKRKGYRSRYRQASLLYIRMAICLSHVTFAQNVLSPA